MAKYEHLPLYKKAMETAIYLHNIVRNFNRYDKYSIGSDLRELSRKNIRLIIQANSSYDKTQILQELVVNCEELKSMVIFAKEIKAFQNFNSFKQSATFVENLCRQSQGWLKSSNSKK
ncbi:MAG: four helix bundle protein [Desulfamplus sp.]|nr:four helix bundle protein [Desulfamplus sp.]